MRAVLRGSHRRRPAIVWLAVILLVAVLPLLERASPRAQGAGPANGYWLVGADGGIFTYGDAAFHGSTGGLRLNQPITGMAGTSSGQGYWLVASDGGIFAFGDARFHGSTGNVRLNKPIVGMAGTSSGQGYWLVASDGGIFAFGDARFHGSTGNLRLDQPIVGLAATRSGAGYWMSAADGGIFTFGDAGFFGAAPEQARKSGAVRRFVGMVPTPAGRGYWEVAVSGEVLAFGDAAALGAPKALNRPLVGVAGVPAGARANGPPAQSPQPPSGVPVSNEPPGPPLPPPQFFSSEANPTWAVSPSTEEKKAGRILALAEVGNMIFIGGEQAGMVAPGTEVGQGPVVPRPFLAALDVATGALLDWDAQPDGAVLSLAPSPDGRRLYVGGRFNSIGGGVSPHLAALDVQTGQLDPTFRPPTPDSTVRAMALQGNKLFIGGSFDKLGDLELPAAALDAGTGALLGDWIPPENEGGRFKGQTGRETEDGNPGIIYDMAVTGDGEHLVIVGDFLHFGDQGGMLVVSTATGAKADWQPEMDRPVFGVASAPVDPDMYYVSTGGTGGQVQAYRVGGATREPLWIHKTDGDAMDVAATSERLYLVGHYDYVLGGKTVCGKPPCEGHQEDGDTPNRHLSAFDAATGAHDLSFTAQANTPQGPYVALVGRDHLYVGGDFTKINDRPQGGFVQFNAVR